MRLRADYLAIATIGIAEILRLVLKNESWMTNGVRGIAGIERPFAGTPLDSPFGYLLVVVAFVVLVYFLLERAYASPWGRVLRAIRENEPATAAAGKSIARFRLQAFVQQAAILQAHAMRGKAGDFFDHLAAAH